TTQDYVLQQSGGNWTVRRADTGAAVPFTVNGGNLEFDGLSVAGNGPAADGDQFLVRPTVTALRDLRALLCEPSRVPAASPARTPAGAKNAGTATISAGQVLDANDPALLDTVTITFTDAGNWEARDAANTLLGAYVPGDAIEFNGWSVAIDGATAAGDSF